MTDREAGVIAKIRAVDEALGRRDMSPVASERVRQTLARHAQARSLRARLRWWPALAFAAGAALMAVLLLERREGGERGAVARREAEAPPIASQEVVLPPEPRCDPLGTGALRLASDGCLAGDGVRVSAWAPATLERAGDRVTVQDGEVMFEVEPRPGRPLHVLAGVIDIEVVGTRFIVRQRDGAGRVSLLEGRLRVRGADGSVVALAAGEEFAWPALPQVPAPPPSRRRPASAAPPSADAGLAELLAEVAELRREGRYPAAVARLRAADARAWSSRSRQLVSFEIGTLLERQLGDTAAACAHWREHRERFPGGSRDEIVARSLAKLGCAAE
ncbi:FecR family protein [Nannocystis sp. ILAH1]|uniref:FecR family protein n=1 Tax=unclassified Nannocystis TaxID=2627009 RepID=UPI0022710E2A|nr:MULTISPECIES: FecR family protein [unclassified Nannocystis]MCY0989299.1 FecR family protein [Nannocystis sp. ILAH1]MCY1065006.1 FecR family protein [Nannocystis sp. RBIL2]